MKYEIKSSAIIYELLDDEIILANLETGIYYSLRGSAIPIWQLLISRHSSSSIGQIFTERYQRDVSSTILPFIDELLKEDLLVERPFDLNPDLPSLLWPKEFSVPSFEKYQEMKNLLMLDPIHEVDEQGWPSRSR